MFDFLTIFVSLTFPTVNLGLRASPGAAPDCFLGLLSSIDGYQTYGFVANTRNRILVAVDNPMSREEDIRRFIHMVNVAYINEVCNPFYTRTALGGASRRFKAAIESLAATWGTLNNP